MRVVTFEQSRDSRPESKKNLFRIEMNFPFLVLLGVINGISALAKRTLNGPGTDSLVIDIIYGLWYVVYRIRMFFRHHINANKAGDAIVMRILHDDSIFNAFMLSGTISRDQMNSVLQQNEIPIEVSVELYENLIKHWIYKILSSCIW